MTRLATDRIPIEERFWAKVRVGAGCWEWTASVSEDGYGRFNIPGAPTRKIAAHRYSFMLHYGPIHNQTVVLHRCDNPKCVRPNHLKDGTTQDNARDMSHKLRGRGQDKTHCPRGHEYNAENTYWRKDTGPRNRQCRACDREKHRERRESAA